MNDEELRFQKIAVWEGLEKVLDRYIDSERTLYNMGCYMKENMISIDDMHRDASKVLKKRYGLMYYTGNYNERTAKFIWWLLEQYHTGNLILKEDAQPKP